MSIASQGIDTLSDMVVFKILAVQTVRSQPPRNGVNSLFWEMRELARGWCARTPASQPEVWTVPQAQQGKWAARQESRTRLKAPGGQGPYLRHP